MTLEQLRHFLSRVQRDPALKQQVQEAITADEVARLKVRANADTGADARKARQLGARGIGLCRTEHMFFQPEALRAIRRMILADDPKSRQRALNDILPLQRAMFRDLFIEMDGLPVTIRLLDPPLHEFLPVREADVSEVASDLGVRVEALHARLEQLHEANPMMGHRGVRLLISYPEVAEMQSRAIFEAATEIHRRTGKAPIPEVMIPLVSIPDELVMTLRLIRRVNQEVATKTGVQIPFKIGTMIETPRAALLADRLAQWAEFLSFGTNDLTQLTYGFSRDDVERRMLGTYLEKGLLTASPFAELDDAGVAALMGIAVERARGVRPDIKIGICGEHGGDPSSIAICETLGLDYVSCSPSRIPVARLAAAHAAMAAAHA
jgi:pyruvate,orthophosphate dikinase